MANKTITDLDDELEQGDVHATNDWMEIDDASEGLTKKIHPRSIIFGGGGLLKDGDVTAEKIIIDPPADDDALTIVVAGAGEGIDITMQPGTTGRGIRATVDVGQAVLYGTDGSAVVSITPTEIQTPLLSADQIASDHFVEKTADETIVSSTVLQNDNHLSVTLSAGVRYAFKFSVFVNVESGTPGIKIGVGGTATPTSFAGQLLAWDSSNALVAAERASAFGVDVPLAAGDAFISIEGSYEVNAGGTFLLAWAQATSSADDTIVQRNSTLVVHRCG